MQVIPDEMTDDDFTNDEKRSREQGLSLGFEKHWALAWSLVDGACSIELLIMIDIEIL